MTAGICKIEKVFSGSLRGDADGSGTFDRSDITALTDWLLTKSGTLGSPESADLNGDSILNAADLSIMLHNISTGGSQ